MDAAGKSDGISTKLHYIATAQYGTTFPKVGEAYAGMFEATGLFDVDIKNGDYSTEYLPKIYFGEGDFDGIGWGASTIFPHVGQHLASYYHSAGSRQKVAFQSFADRDAGMKFGGDPASVEGTAASDALIAKAMASLDFEEQVELIHQWQADNALRMPMITSTLWNGGPNFGLNPPWVKNILAYRDYLEGDKQTVRPHWWIDEKLRKEIQG
jgi:ABC-type transport system substrate-binding protein